MFFGRHTGNEGSVDRAEVIATQLLNQWAGLFRSVRFQISEHIPFETRARANLCVCLRFCRACLLQGKQWREPGGLGHIGPIHMDHVCCMDDNPVWLFSQTYVGL